MRKSCSKHLHCSPEGNRWMFSSQTRSRSNSMRRRIPSDNIYIYCTVLQSWLRMQFHRKAPPTSTLSIPLITHVMRAKSAQRLSHPPHSLNLVATLQYQNIHIRGALAWCWISSGQLVCIRMRNGCPQYTHKQQQPAHTYMPLTTAAASDKQQISIHCFFKTNFQVFARPKMMPMSPHCTSVCVGTLFCVLNSYIYIYLKRARESVRFWSRLAWNIGAKKKKEINKNIHTRRREPTVHL